jgi:hypothetical protein
LTTSLSETERFFFAATRATAACPSAAVVECLLENCCRNPRQRREIFCSSADGARVEEQGEDIAGEWVDVCGEALPGPENSRLIRELIKKNEKRRSARWQNA